jgi:HSP20 family protein
MKLMPWKKNENAAARRGEGPSSLGLFRSEMNRLMDRFFDSPWSFFDEDLLPSVSGWAPSFDVADGERDVTVRMEIPGVDPKDVEVTVSGNVLIISGEKKDSREEKGKHVVRSECSYGSFRRSVELPGSVDAGKVTAEHANGILTVKVEKSKAAAAKRIAVSAK